MSIKNRWIDFLYSIATGSRRVRNFFTPVGALFYGLLIVAFVLLALRLDHWLGLVVMPSPAWRIVLSLPLFALALVLVGWSVANFIKVKGTPVPFNPPPRLVTSGPYAHSRNPMLTGVFALLFGLGLLLGSLSLLLLFTPLFVVLNVWEIKAIEEPELVKRLGRDYIEYRRRTPMFLPNLAATLSGKKRQSA